MNYYLINKIENKINKFLIKNYNWSKIENEPHTIICFKPYITVKLSKDIKIILDNGVVVSLDEINHLLPRLKKQGGEEISLYVFIKKNDEKRNKELCEIISMVFKYFNKELKKYVCDKKY